MLDASTIPLPETIFIGQNATTVQYKYINYAWEGWLKIPLKSIQVQATKVSYYSRYLNIISIAAKTCNFDDIKFLVMLGRVGQNSLKIYSNSSNKNCQNCIHLKLLYSNTREVL